MKWPVPRGPLQAMASLHHLSLGLQNATLGTFAGDGFRRFGLESCWGSAVSQPRTPGLLGAVSELCSREFFADEVATSTEAAPGNGIIASSFFRASERNARQFLRAMVFAGLGLNPAGVLLFRNHALLSSSGRFRSYAPESSLRMKWPLPRRPLQAMASLHHLSLGLQNATLGTFAGVGFRRFGLESCWGSAVSQPRTTELLGAVSELCSREFLADEVATSTGAAPGNGIIASSFFRSSERNVRHFCGRLVFAGLGLNPAWGSAVSQPRTTELLGAVSELCSREFLADEVATSTGAAPGNGIIASSFFRSSERNVRHFCGRLFSQVWA